MPDLEEGVRELCHFVMICLQGIPTCVTGREGKRAVHRRTHSNCSTFVLNREEPCLHEPKAM